MPIDPKKRVEGEKPKKKRRKRKGGTKWDPYRDEFGLTPKKRAFVEYFANPESETFLNATKSTLRAFNCKDYHNANIMAYFLKKDKRVMKAIDQIIKEDEELDKLVLEGMHKRLKRDTDRGWQATADFWAKIKGIFAPEKHEHTHMRPEDRDERYAEIIKKVRDAQLPQPTERLHVPTTEDQDRAI